MTPTTRPGGALAAMLGVQVLATLALVAASVLAPVVAPRLGLSPARIGLYMAVAYLAAMLAGLRCGHWVARHGPVRVSQAALLASAAGAAAAAAAGSAASALATVLLLAAAAIGVGYGLVNPASAAVLSHHAPAQSRGLFFSIKQTGVPLGVALAGLLMPAGLVVLDWQATALAVALACALAALALQPLRVPLDPPAAPGAAAPAGIGALLRRVWHTPRLRRLSLASLAYAATQQAFVTFLVSMLNLGLGWSLAVAAGVLSASQVVATGARIGFGALADRWGAPGRLLAQLGAAMSLGCLALAALASAAGAPAALVVAAALGCAATAMGWNGVFFAELALRVPRHEMAPVAGATQFFTFAGGMLGPLLFGEALRAGAGWPLAWCALAAVPAAAALMMARGLRAEAAAGPGVSAPRS
jgi:MFS family permease